MEFSVSKSALLNELSTTQGVVERKTTIPILSNYLFEAAARIVRLYEDWGNTDKATTWKAKLGMPDLPAEVFARP